MKKVLFTKVNHKLIGEGHKSNLTKLNNNKIKTMK